MSKAHTDNVSWANERQTFWQPLIHVKRRQRLGVYLRHRTNIITKIKGLWFKYLYDYYTDNTNNTHRLKGSVHPKKTKKNKTLSSVVSIRFYFYFSRLWNFSFLPNIIKVNGIVFVLLSKIKNKKINRNCVAYTLGTPQILRSTIFTISLPESSSTMFKLAAWLDIMSVKYENMLWKWIVFFLVAHFRFARFFSSFIYYSFYFIFIS